MDDEPLILRTMNRMIQRLGYKTGTAINGNEAIKCYKEAMNDGSPYDCVLLDLKVNNGLGGLETFKELQSKDKNIKAIVVSGSTNEAPLLQPDKFGFKAKLAKPFSLGDLQDVLRRSC